MSTIYTKDKHWNTTSLTNALGCVGLDDPIIVYNIPIKELKGVRVVGHEPWNKGKRLTEQDKKKKSIGRKRYLDNNPEAKKKLIEAGKKAAATNAKRRAKTYLVTFPDGSQHTITNLNKFCRENNVNQGNLCAGRPAKGYKASLIGK
jgi:hypothetical protein